MESKTILFVGDMHVGSVWGLWSEDVVDNYGKEIPMLSHQYWLQERWNEMLKNLPKRFDLLVLLGDIVDGLGYAKYGRELMTQDLTVQTETAIRILKPLASRAKAVIALTGTDYHQTPYEELDRRIASALNARYVGYRFDFKMNGKVISIRHGKGGTYWYRGTRLDKDLFQNLLASACNIVDKADLIVRGHLHFYSNLKYKNQQIITTPCWQLMTDYLTVREPDKFFPDIGAVFVEYNRFIYDRSEELGIIWNHPKLSALDLEREIEKFERSGMYI